MVRKSPSRSETAAEKLIRKNNKRETKEYSKLLIWLVRMLREEIPPTTLPPCYHNDYSYGRVISEGIIDFLADEENFKIERKREQEKHEEHFRQIKEMQRMRELEQNQKKQKNNEENTELIKRRKNKIAELEKEQKEKNKIISNLEKEKTELEKQERTAAEKISKLEEKIKRLDIEKNKAEADLVGMDFETTMNLNSKNKEIEKLNKTIADLEAKQKKLLDQKDKDIKKLEKEKSDFELKQINLEERIKELEEEAKVIRKGIDKNF
jgi:DNA repair exonuclease SbcCD ATPase subunit